MKKETLRDHDLNLEKLAEQLHNIADSIEKHEAPVTKVEIGQSTEINEPIHQEISISMVATQENMLRTEDLYFLHDK